MTDFSEIFSNFFMLRALVAGMALGLMLSYLGIFAVLKKMSFFSDGISHASLAGIAAGLILGINPFITALIFALLLAGIIYLFEKSGRLSADAAIGIIFSAGIAVGVLFMNLNVSFQRDLNSFLFGNILSIRGEELWIIASVSLIVFFLAFLTRRRLALLSLDYEMSYASGVNTAAYQFIFYLVLAAAVVVGIKLLGIFLVSALLIIPVSSAKQFAFSFASLEKFSVILAELAVLSGLVISYFLDWPTGATIVLIATVFFLVSFVIGRLVHSRQP